MVVSFKKLSQHQQLFTSLEFILIILMLFLVSVGFLGMFQPESFMILPGIIAAALIILLGVYWGFAFYYLLTFFTPVELPGMPFSLNQVAGVIFILAWLKHYLLAKTSLPRSGFLTLMILIVLYFSISALTGEDFSAGLRHFLYLVNYLILALMLASMITSQREVKLVFWIILGLTFFTACVGLFEFVTGIDLFTESRAIWQGRVRINAMAPNCIVFAFNCTFAFPFGYYIFSETRKLFPRFLALSLAIFVNLVALLTFNRQTFVIVGAEFFLAALLFKNRYSRLFLIILIVVALILSSFLMKSIIERAKTIEEITRDYSLIRREDALKVGLNMVKQKPLFGIGFGSFPTTWPKYLTHTTFFMFDKTDLHYPDLGYNQILCETGLIGLIFFLLFYYGIIRLTLRTRTQALVAQERAAFNYAACMLTLTLIYLLINFIQDTFLYVRTWLFFGFVLAMTHPGFLYRKKPER